MSIRHCSETTDTAVHRPTRITGVLLLAAFLAAGSGAHAVEVLTVHELVSHCEFLEQEPEGVDGQYCIRYIQGFIDGSVATDVRVMLNAEVEAPSTETFSQRAKRTRSPTRADRFRAAQLAGFCLGDPLPLRDVVDRVVVDLIALDVDDTAQSPARDAVYISLRENYPCRDE